MFFETLNSIDELYILFNRLNKEFKEFDIEIIKINNKYEITYGYTR